MSSGYEEQELTAIDAALDDNPDATSSEVFQATRPYDERAIASVAASRALAGGGGSSASVFARVRLTTVGGITDWDGSSIPFDAVDYDPDGLWDAVGSRFTAQVAGWYRLATGNITTGAIDCPAEANDGSKSIVALVFGAGDNLKLTINQHTDVTSGAWAFPPLVGEVHLGVGDAVALQGDGGTGWTVPRGFTFSLYLVAAT